MDRFDRPLPTPGIYETIGATTLQRSRLTPPRLPNRWLRRDRLLTALEPGVTDRVVVLHAPAGAGKSTLVADWLADRRPPSAWLTLDSRDSALPVFVRHLAAALRAIAPGFGAGAPGRVGGPADADFDLIRRTFIDEVFDLPEGAHVVLDGLHLIEPGPSFDLVSDLLRFTPPQVRWILLTRAPIPAPGPLLRSRATLRDLRFSDLCLTADETRTLLAPGDVAPPAEAAVSEIQAFTGGWPTLVRAFLDRLPPAAGTSDVADILADDLMRDLGRFLTTDTLQYTPPGTIDLVLATAVCEALNPDLALALVAPSAPAGLHRAVYTSCTHDGVLTEPVAGRPGWIRWRPVVRRAALDLLGEREGGEVLRRQHRIAATWLAGAGETSLAIGHALLAADRELAATIAARAGFAALACEDTRTLADALALLPATIIDARADLLVLQAWIDWSRGESDGIVTGIRKAQALLATDALPQEVADRATGYLGALIARHAPASGGIEETLGAVTTTFSLLPAADTIGRGVAVQALAVSSVFSGRPEVALAALNGDRGLPNRYSTGLGAAAGIGLATIAYLDSHDHDAAHGHLVEAAHQATRFDLALTGDIASAWLACLALHRHDLAMAEQHLAAIRSHADRSHVGTWPEVCGAEALCLALRGNHGAATASLSQALDQAIARGCGELIARLRAIEARLALLRSDHASALRWSLATGVTVDADPIALLDAPVITAIRALAASPHPDHRRRALVLASDAVDDATDLRHRPLLVRALAARAVARASVGDDAGAHTDLDLPLADVAVTFSPLHLLECGLPLARILATMPTTHPHYVLARILAGQIHTAPPDRLAWPHPLLVRACSLSRREIEVLERLSAPMANKAIAAALHVAPATVKIHVASVLEKLGVANRMEAALISRVLGLNQIPMDSSFAVNIDRSP